MKRHLKYGLLALLGVTVVAYGLDSMFAATRKDQFGTVKVDQMYAITNRWNHVEYSVGQSKDERCVNALFPHFGSRPCWYVNAHTLSYVRGG